MLRLLIPTGSGYTWVEHSPPAPFPDEFLWADLFEPTLEEEKAVESLLTVDVPTRDEMSEIETSNRLYEEDGAVYMTATVGSKLDSATPESSAITFILANNRLITNRYVGPDAGAALHARTSSVTRRPARRPPRCSQDCSKRSSSESRTCSSACRRNSTPFRTASSSASTARRSPSSGDLQAMIQQIGANGDLVSKARESLVSFQRLLMYVQQASERRPLAGPARPLQVDAARRAVALGPRDLPRQQDPVPARRGARADQPRAEQHHQDLLGRRRDVPAADAGREHLRHELPASCRSSTSTGAIRWRSLAMVVSAVVPYLYFRRKGWL